MILFKKRFIEPILSGQNLGLALVFWVLVLFMGVK